MSRVKSLPYDPPPALRSRCRFKHFNWGTFSGVVIGLAGDRDPGQIRVRVLLQERSPEIELEGYTETFSFCLNRDNCTWQLIDP